ncbi:MAG: C-terminal binding protein, partial [Chloroflexota bacterium]
MAADPRPPVVVVTDFSFTDDLAVEKAALEPLGCTVVGAQCRTAEEVAAVVKDADFVFTQFAPVTEQAIQAMSRARLITRYGIGVDNVDLVAARERGIPVYNVPDYCIDEVADHTLGLILSLTRQIAPLSASVKAGGWKRPLPLPKFYALRDLTTGVVGCGRIGRQVITRLTPFRTKILAYDPAMSADQITALGAMPVSLDQLYQQSDLVTLHCPSTTETRRMINTATLSRMKDGVIFINVARGTLVDQDDLIEALRTGKVGAAGLDVTDPEPIEHDSPLLSMNNVVITNHCASGSDQAAALLRRGVI